METTSNYGRNATFWRGYSGATASAQGDSGAETLWRKDVLALCSFFNYKGVVVGSKVIVLKEYVMGLNFNVNSSFDYHLF